MNANHWIVELKSIMRAELNKHICDEILQKYKEMQENGLQFRAKEINMPHFNKPFACSLLLKIWDNVQAFQILDGWQLAIYGEEM